MLFSYLPKGISMLFAVTTVLLVVTLTLFVALLEVLQRKSWHHHFHSPLGIKSRVANQEKNVGNANENLFHLFSLQKKGTHKGMSYRPYNSMLGYNYGQYQNLNLRVCNTSRITFMFPQDPAHVCNNL